MWNNTTPVAVKTLKSDQNITIDNFLQSANLMKKSRHPNLVHLYAICSMGFSIIKGYTPTED
jgi:fyn-related kinase